MKNLILIILTFISLASCSSSIQRPKEDSVKKSRVIPSQFHGTWDGGYSSHEARYLTVSGTSIKLYESDAQVFDVIIYSPKKIKVLVRGEAEGEPFVDNYLLTLTEEGKLLKDGVVRSKKR